MRKVWITVAAAVCCVLVAGCGETAPEMASVHSKPVKLAAYLYEMEYSQYSPESGRAVLDDTNKLASGAACSVVRNGRYIGRNLDFFYDEMAEIVISVKAAPGRYASIGVSSCNPNLTPKEIDRGRETPYYDAVPYFVVDGINEKGVYASINMAPTGDLGVTTGTNPGAETLCGTEVVRFVLDNCATAQEACERLSKMNIVGSAALGEFHYMIADPQDTYVLETIDNKVLYSKEAGKILTNYFLLHDVLTPHACGMEREALLAAHYDEGRTLEGMCGLMQRAKYSQIYDRSVSPFWYSDFYGDSWKGEVFELDSPREPFEPMIDAEIEEYKHRTRSYLNDIWITVHTSVYDFEAKTLRVFSQEDYNTFWDFKVGE